MTDKKQLITNYFSNSLSDEEQELFDHLLDSDVDFKAEVTFQRGVKNTIHRIEHQKLKNQLKGVEKDLVTKRTLPKSKIWFAAASVALLLALFSYFNRAESTEALYATYYQPAKNTVHPIVRSNEVNNLQDKAFIAYSDKNYQEAHLLFKELYIKNRNSELLFYDAITLLEIDSTALAIEKLKLHSEFSDAVSNKTNWYLALAFLKNNEIEQSKQLLKSIIDTEGYKSENARKLLKNLD